MTSEPSAPPPIVEVRHRIATAAGAALLVAGVLLVTTVLPAEFAVDPTGIGRRLGLLDLGVTGQAVEQLNAAAAGGAGGASGASAVPILAKQPGGFRQETVEFRIAPRGSLEYKYRLDKGQPMFYAWKATTTVNFEAHAEPDGAPRGYAQSYEKGAAAADSGTLTAPFAGIHGWYWENPSDTEATVTLTTAGFYTISHEFRAGEPVKNKTFQ